MDDTREPTGAPGRMLGKRSLAVLFAALVSLGALFAKETPDGTAIEQTPLAAVKITGNQTIPAEAILTHVKSRPGRPASGAMISEDVQQLYRTDWFISVVPQVATTDDGPELTFEVIERPVVQSVEYRGNKELDDEHLTALTGLRKGSPYTPHSNIEAARRMENHYREKGFAFAEVTLAAGGESAGRNVVFEIHEGPKVRVKDITFVGNSGWTIASGLSDSNLRMRLQTERMFPIVPGMLALPFGGLYKPETIPNDIANLKEYYHGLGFFDVEITHKKLFNDDKSRLVIQYNIDQGMRYRVSKISYEGYGVYSKRDLTAQRSLEPGDFFSKRALGEDVAYMKDLYGELGRLFSSVKPIVQYSETPGKVSLVYKIDEDRPIYVRNITTDVRGDNPHSRETLLLNLAQIHPGDLADPDLIRRTKSRIGGSGLFERGPTNGVKIDIERVSFDELDPPPMAASDDPLFRGQNSDAPHTPNPYAAPAPRQPVQSVRKTAPPYLPPVERQPAAGPPAAAQPVQSQPVVQAGGSMPAVAPYSNSSPFSPPASPGSGPPPVVHAGGPVNPYVHQQGVQPVAGEVGAYAPPVYPTSPQGDPFTDYVRTGQAPGYIDLNISAAEARTGRLMIGASVNSNSGVMGNIVFSEDNFDLFRLPRSPRDIWNGTAFRGAGQKFRVEAVPGSVVSRYLVSWTDPFIFDTPYSLGTTGFYFQRFYPDWNEERAGGRVSLGRQITRNLSIKGIVRAENVELWDPDVPTPPLLQEAVGDSLLLTGGAGLTWDNRDSPLLPSEGQKIDFTYTQGVTDFQYPRFDLEGTQYYTLFSRPDGTGKHILSLGGQLGWTGDDTPIFERYFAGGFQSLRGFEYRGVGPRQSGVNIGGQFLLAGSVQYMFPLLANDALHGVVFSDFGTVNEDISIDNFRASVGTGLRISIPAFGPAPLAFDFAFPVAKIDGDEEQIFSFYIGLQR